MNNIQAKKDILKGKLECLKNTTSQVTCNRECDNCEINYKQGNIGEQKEALELAIKSLNENKKNNMKILMCPKCGASTLALRENGNYLCLMCNHEFDSSPNNPYHKIVTVEYTTKKSLVFPKLDNYIVNDEFYSKCLFVSAPDSLDCDNIDCDNCIFAKENYKMFTDVKKGE